MKRISFYARRNRSGNLLHIETDGCIVNIQVGLRDMNGRQVTSVRVSPDNYAEPGGRWVLDGSRVVQLLPGEDGIDRTCLTVGWNRDEQDIAQLALHRMAFSAPDSEVSPNMRESARTALKAINTAREEWPEQ